MSSKARPFIIQAVIAIIIVALGYYFYHMYMTDATVPQRGKRVDSGVLVQVIEAHKTDHPIRLDVTGTVSASRTMNIKSEASGRITYINPKYYPGSHLKKGDIIAKISTEDYKIKLTQAKITLSQKETALLQEEAKGRAAEAELSALQKTILNGKDLTAEQEALIKRAPQLQSAIADVEMAKTQLQQAQINFDRSVVRLPYDAVLEETPISIGDYISGASSLGTIAADDEVWITVSLQPSLVEWTGASEDALSKIDVAVSYEMGGNLVTRKARVLSMLGEVESLGRMVQLVLAVDNPFGDPVDRPLLIGTFVHVTLNMPNALSSFEVPRAHIREGNQIYIMSKDDTLNIRRIHAPYKTDSHVYITEGLEEGDRIVTTLISTPVNGKKLRTQDGDAEKRLANPSNAGDASKRANGSSDSVRGEKRNAKENPPPTPE